MEGTEVRPRRALEAFDKWEHTCERLTRDILRRGGSRIMQTARVGTAVDFHQFL